MFESLITFWWQYLILVIASYLFGSVNYSIIFSHLVKKDDVRKYGSGNAGTTNMFRVYGTPLAFVTFLCDSLKGVLACLVAKFVFATVSAEEQLLASYLAGVVAVIGHIAPVYYKLRGGKGFATTIGICFVLQPLLMLCMIVPTLLLIVLSDRMSVAALFFVSVFTACHWIFFLSIVGIENCILASLITILVFVTHRSNIVRIVTGQEPALGLRKQVFGKFHRNRNSDVSK